MKAYATDTIRNVGLYSHVGAGKTSLAEAMLFATGAIYRLGSVDQHCFGVRPRASASLSQSRAFDARGPKLNFRINEHCWRRHAICTFRLAPVLVVDVTSGVQVGTEESGFTDHEFPRLIFVNRMAVLRTPTI